MSTLHEAAQQALTILEAWKHKGMWGDRYGVTDALRAALAEPVPDSKYATIAEWRADKQPLSDEQIENAYREIWRDLPSDFDHTSSGWIEQGIKYAERAHGIGGSDE